ncbi:hypothetical protein [Yoonia sp. 2307UL14-13]|uniref:hypothetical protein n=1 Tax=Yoonia sp. 2307UL14-13 TaxID=3126506 RepID=UPI0030AAC844
MAQPSDNASPDGLNRIAIGFSVGWLVVVGLFFWILPPARQSEGFDSLRFVMVLIAVFMPLAMVWLAVVAARAAREAKDEAFRLQSEIDLLRQAFKAQNQEEAKPAKSRFTTRREVSRLIVPKPAPQPVAQQTLPLDAEKEEEPPLDRRDLISALNFPDDENDTEGFAALRRALRDRSARRLIQASQDVLTLLSQDGTYMDDLRPGPTSADLWRRFAGGERGGVMGILGGVQDEGRLSAATTRMREDAIFRDTVHHFLRKFDQMLVTFSEHATDTDLLALADTRTARAFMLMGRAAGTFD